MGLHWSQMLDSIRFEIAVAMGKLRRWEDPDATIKLADANLVVTTKGQQFVFPVLIEKEVEKEV